MVKRSKIDKSLTILEELRNSPLGTSCSICGRAVPEARKGIRACLCSRCTYGKADAITKKKVAKASR